MLDLTRLAKFSARPFRHWVFDGVLSFVRCCEMHAATPLADWPDWVRYDNALEIKRTTRDLDALPDALQTLFAKLTAPEMGKLLSPYVGVDLVPDETLHGGGLHVVPPGGYLQTHLDYAMHPGGMERRLNLVLFLHSKWSSHWGGELELLDADGETVVESIQPRPGRMVLFEACDAAYHGVAEVLGPVPRITANVSYLAPPRAGATRRRALFVPRR